MNLSELRCHLPIIYRDNLISSELISKETLIDVIECLISIVETEVPETILKVLPNSPSSAKIIDLATYREKKR